jgi:hypothetical protein
MVAVWGAALQSELRGHHGVPGTPAQSIAATWALTNRMARAASPG